MHLVNQSQERKSVALILVKFLASSAAKCEAIQIKQ